jgi:hypothetical protein
MEEIFQRQSLAPRVSDRGRLLSAGSTRGLPSASHSRTASAPCEDPDRGPLEGFLGGFGGISNWFRSVAGLLARPAPLRACALYSRCSVSAPLYVLSFPVRPDERDANECVRGVGVRVRVHDAETISLTPKP